MLVHSPSNVWNFTKRYWALLPAVMLILAAVEWTNDYLRYDQSAFPVAAVGLLISALSIFLAFRVNESYARWWEARILWGSIVNASRSFARNAIALTYASNGDEAQVEEIRLALIYRHIAYVNALRLTLRNQENWEEVRPFISDEEYAKLLRAGNKPVWLLQRQGEELAGAVRSGWMSEIGHNQFDRTLLELHNAQGGCERIKNTPFPVNMTRVTQLIAWGIAVVVPITIANQSNDFELIDMIVVPFLMLAFVVVERLGAELKNPFDDGYNATPMTSICRGIERDLRQSLDEHPLPPKIEPDKGILM